VAKNHKLIKVRGNTSTFTVQLPPSSTASDILAAGVAKHRSCNFTLPATQYVLLYDDGRPANYLPGENTPFSLAGFTERTGKKYRDLCLYICSQEDFRSGIISYLEHAVCICYNYAVFWSPLAK
jgi:hypothetical protein